MEQRRISPAVVMIWNCLDWFSGKVTAQAVRRCRVCGCTDDDCRQCVEKTGHPCHWVEEDLCSACADDGFIYDDEDEDYESSDFDDDDPGLDGEDEDFYEEDDDFDGEERDFSSDYDDEEDPYENDD